MPLPTPCQHCNGPFMPHGTEVFCSAFCAFSHLKTYYAAYGFESAPNASVADDWYKEAVRRPAQPEPECDCPACRHERDLDRAEGSL